MFLKKTEKGFTLLEIMIVIAIISILTTIIVPSAPKFIKKARDAKVKEQLSAIRTAVFVYFGANSGKYPGSLDDLLPDYISGFDKKWVGANADGTIGYHSENGRVFLQMKNSTKTVDNLGKSYSEY